MDRAGQSNSPALSRNSPALSRNSPSLSRNSPAPSRNSNTPDRRLDYCACAVNAPKYGTKVPNRLFVGGLEPMTTDADLYGAFSVYGEVRTAKVIVDRAGVSKGYGFVTFLYEEDAQGLMASDVKITLRNKQLTLAPAIKKQMPYTDQFYHQRFGETPRATAHPSYSTGNPIYFNSTSIHESRLLNQPYTLNHVNGQYGQQTSFYVPTQYPAYAQGLNQHSAYPIYYQNAVPAQNVQHTVYMGADGQQYVPAHHMSQAQTAWMDPGMAAQCPESASGSYVLPMY